jgi:hypothetical protein
MNGTSVNDTLAVSGAQSVEPGPKPYPRSFVDRLIDGVQRLPVPYWLTYLALFVLTSFAGHLAAWFEGWTPVYTFIPIALAYPLWLGGPLAIMTYLDALSPRALSEFSPLLNLSPDALDRLRYEFTTMPARPVLISSLLWSIVYLIILSPLSASLYAANKVGPILIGVFISSGFVSFSIGSAIYYHSIRQLRLVHLTVRSVKQFDLFRLGPVYAFSVLTSRTAMAWVLLLSATQLVFPIQANPIPNLLLLAGQVVLAVAAFTLPLRVVNERLTAEKRRLLAEVDQRVKTTLARLHRCIDENDLSDVSQLNSVITGLNAERDLLAKIPTWPWRAGMLSGFLSAVVLPIILFLVQLVIQNVLGG